MPCMEYRTLAIGLSDELFHALREALIQYKLQFTTSPSLRDANRLLSCQIFHLLIVDIDYLRDVQQIDWLNGVRRNSFAPLIILSDTPEKDTNGMVRLGADMCISGKWPSSMIADLAYAQLRRYTEYNHFSDSGGAGLSAFQLGDIFIDPARQEVTVCGQPVNLRHREFSLLLYFMQNPNIVLTAEQICEHAWRMEYTQPVDRAVHELRKQIEPDPACPRYVKTVYRVGYRFTAYRSEIEKAVAL